MNILSEKEQDSLLSKSLKKIKEQIYFINNTISQNKLRQCLKESFILLNELRTNNLTPGRYYTLYMSIFDIMLNIKNFFAEEISKGRALIELYDKVQQAKYAIPRIYLMIIVGSIYMEKVPKSVHVILFDLLGVVKQVQNPVKGLFIRNYLLKMVKDKLPDKGNIYEKEGGTFEDSVKFLIQNIEEMTLLWVRLLIGVEGIEKKKREIERDELKILIGESMYKLSSLESLNKEIYEEQILPKLLKVIIDSKDALSQQYLMECIIHSFPNSYNIKCIEQILDTMTQLEEGVDIGVLFINLMDKIGQYFGDVIANNNNKDKDSSADESFDLKDIIKSAKDIYPVLLDNFEVIMNSNINKEIKEENDKKKNISNMPLLNLLDLICSFLKFSIKCSPNEQRSNAVIKIINYTIEIINKFHNKINEKENKKICDIIFTPVKGGLNIFNIDAIYKLMELLDNNTKKKIGKELINYLVKNINNKNVEKLDSIESLKKIIKYIQPLLSDSKNPEEKIDDINIIQEEQYIVCKLLYIITAKDPEIIYEILNQFKNIFSYGGSIRRKFSLPVLVNSILIFCHKIAICYENKTSKLPKDIKKVKLKSIIKTIDITKITSDDIFYKLMTNIFKLLNEAIGLISQENIDIGFKLYIYCASLVNEITIEKEKFSEACLSFTNKALDLLDFNSNDSNDKNNLNKIKCIEYLSSYIINYTIFNKEQKNILVNKLIKITEESDNRKDQFKLMIIISQLYYSLFKDGKKVSECLVKARRYADFAMMTHINLFLYVDLVNKMIYFVEKADEVLDIKKEQIEDLIELIKGHIKTIKNGNNDADKKYVDELEKYFSNTKNILIKRKKHKNDKLKEFYQSINI